MADLNKEIVRNPSADAVFLMLQVGVIADEILEASIDPRGLSAGDILDDNQGAILHVKIIEILSDRIRALTAADQT